MFTWKQTKQDRDTGGKEINGDKWRKFNFHDNRSSDPLQASRVYCLSVSGQSSDSPENQLQLQNLAPDPLKSGTDLDRDQSKLELSHPSRATATNPELFV